MKRWLSLLLAAAMLLSLAACGADDGANSPSTSSSAGISTAPEQAAPEANLSDSIFDCYEEDIKAWVSELGYSAPAGTAGGEDEPAARQLQVTFDGGSVVYALNDSAASDSLLEQLPLTMEIEDYSTNEKIFYPPQALDTADTPPAEGGAGTLAYYAPWGDVVLFYGDYNQNPSLYELGQVVSGGELVSAMTGTVTIEAVS